MKDAISVTVRWSLGVLIFTILALLGCSSGGGGGSREGTGPGLNSSGGSLTIVNARIWTGDAADPWKSEMTIRDGMITAMDAANPAGLVIDAGGRLVIPGMSDGHTHAHAPYMLTSPDAPSLFGCRTPEEVLGRLRDYVQAHPGDRFPRLFGWMRAIFPPGQNPTRQMIDAVVADRPVYLVCNDGHQHWANTKALEVARALHSDPPDMRGDGYIERDAAGLATGFLKETEYAATHGVLLNAVRRVQPFSLEEQAAIQGGILAQYSRYGVTSIYTKDGDPGITRVYAALLRADVLPVRATLDSMYTPYSQLSDIAGFRRVAEEIEHSDLPRGFLRADSIKLFLDLPVKDWIWMLEPYTDGGNGKPAFPLEDFRAQMFEADRQGLQINVSIYGDRALRECLNIIEEIADTRPPRDRRFMIEHAQYIPDADLPRFKALGVIASMNPIVSYPNMEFQGLLASYLGKERQDNLFQMYPKMLAHGVDIVNGSDFPLAPMDPLIGMHILVTGTDIYGQPAGGLWPHKLISVEEALRTYTVRSAYGAFAEDHLGRLKVGFAGDLVMLSEDILSPQFDPRRLAWTKAVLTVFNGHIVHEDFSPEPKVIDFVQ